jgi:sigma-54 dependent transcriptional regulator, acetoin dehydrogenase operon transcriptional activator AcoR
VILTAHSDRAAVDPVSRARLIEGARWGEETPGTNAIGTALVEGASVGVVGKAHFEVRNRDLFCYATPVRDAYGEIVAVLDVSGPLRSHDEAVGSAVQAAGAALERALRSVSYVDERTGPFAAIERLVLRAADATVLIEASGALRVVNAAARAAFWSLTPGAGNASCEQLFGMSFQELLATAAGRGGMHFETRSGAFRLAVEPITGVGQRTLAALVHFEPERGSSPRHAKPEPTRPAVPNEFDPILGRDPGLLGAKQLAARFARTSLPVLLLAETGTGKELFARAIHAVSPARSGAFVAVNCGALSPELMLSELFGYAPGAYHGATRTGSEGRIGAAHGGTLFLDEIAEMSDALQAALLRVLDNGVYQRVGESRERRADFRLICATCRDLPALVAEGKFRRDLFYRVHGARLSIPAVRERNDVAWLAERPIERLEPQGAPSLSESARRFIAEQSWPGNVRELKSALGHALALAPNESQLEAQHFPQPLLTPVTTPSAPSGNESGPASQTRQRIVRDAIEATLRACAGNVSEAARPLRVGRGTIYRTIRNKKA